jgi:UDP-2,3-diacylglucosamine pyrophosphatase LpxH
LDVKASKAVLLELVNANFNIMLSSHETRLNYRSVWISDLHLGSRFCQSSLILDFLTRVRCERLYLVGDIVDLLAMEKRYYWPTSHGKIVRRLLQIAQQGTEVIYIPGNHDAKIRTRKRRNFGQITICNQAIHIGMDDRKWLVTHGDLLVPERMHTGFLHKIGTLIYDQLLILHRYFSMVRGYYGLSYWSLPRFLKQQSAMVQRYITEFETNVMATITSMRCDGLICGHIHYPRWQQQQGVTYYNCGDWVENCSALVETWTGHLQLITWPETQLTPVAQTIDHCILDPGRS